MSKKQIVVGLSPEYNYPGELDKKNKSNTYYASNHGASFITQTLCKLFDAPYLNIYEDYSEDIPRIKNEYEYCLVSLSTHITPHRNIKEIVKFVEKTGLQPIIFSLGIHPAFFDDLLHSKPIHSSLKRLLDIASQDDNWIGVRGNYSATILLKNGFKNVVPVGCPTLLVPQSPDFTLQKKDSFENPLIVYRRDIFDGGYPKHIKNIRLLGQDYQDDILFRNEFSKDTALHEYVDDLYDKITDHKRYAYKTINQNGYFPYSFEDWYSQIGQHDFVIGPRLHGCIAALVQGIPSVFVNIDTRVTEIAELFKLPSISLKTFQQSSIESIFRSISFEKFNAIYGLRYRNFCSLINENGLSHELSSNESNKSIFDYDLLAQDILAMNQIKFLESSNVSCKKKDISSFKKLKNKVKMFLKN